MPADLGPYFIEEPSVRAFKAGMLLTERDSATPQEWLWTVQRLYPKQPLCLIRRKLSSLFLG